MSAAEHAATVRFKDAVRAVRPRYRELNSPLWDVCEQAVALAERATELERKLTEAEALARHQATEIDEAQTALRQIANTQQATSSGEVPAEQLQWLPISGAAARDIARAALGETAHDRS